MASLTSVSSWSFHAWLQCVWRANETIIEGKLRGYSKMNVARPSKIFLVLGALFVAVLTVFSGFEWYHVSAQSAEPRAQGSEDVGSSRDSFCWYNGLSYDVGQPCGEKTNTEACKFSQPICTQTQAGAQCVPQLGNEPSSTMCDVGRPCDPPDYCDGAGNCRVNATFSCPAEETCFKYECSSNYSATSCVSVAKPKINATCTKTTDPIVCGQLYWVTLTEDTPAQCGGDGCATKYQLRADPCQSITCTGSQHTREFGAANPNYFSVCREGTTDVTSLMTTLGTFAAGPGITAAVQAQPYDVPYVTAPTRTNYTVLTVPAKVTITKKPVSCSVRDAVKVYGDSNPAFSFLCGAFVSPDTQASIFGSTVPVTTAQRDSPVGSYDITLAAPDHQNYAIRTTKGTLRIDPAPVTCSTTNLTLTPDVTYSQAFVESGFSASRNGTRVDGRWSFTDINGNPLQFGTRPTAPSTFTVKGVFTPSSSNFTSTNCQLDITVRQCTAATVAQDCTQDDGNACTQNACDESTGMCYHKPTGPTTSGSLSPVMTLTCPDTIRIDFNDILQCVDPADTTALYRLGIATQPVTYGSYRGSLVSMDNTVVSRSSCSNGRCSFTTKAYVFYRESPYAGVPPRISPPLHVGVAAFAGGRLLSEGQTSQAVSCPSGSCTEQTCSGGKTWSSSQCACICVTKTCGAGEEFNATSCMCEPLCGNGRLDPGEECDASAGAGGNCLGYGCVGCRRDYNAKCASIFTSTCTGNGSSLNIMWGPNLEYQSGTSIYRCHSDPSCCPPTSPPANTVTKSASRTCTVSPNGTFGHDYDISNACPHGRHVRPPTYHVSCTCNQQGVMKKCLSAVDGVSDSAEYLREDPYSGAVP